MSFMSRLLSRTSPSDAEQKAFIADTAVNMWQFFYGQSSSKVYSPKQLLAYNVGWVYTCNNKTAQTLATVPVKLYYRNPTGKEVKHYKTMPISTRQARMLSGIMRKDMSNTVEIEDHPVVELLHCPNDRMNWTDFSAFIQSYLGLIGNAYVLIERDKAGMPVALWPLLSENVSCVVKDNGLGYGEIVSYKYSNNLNDSGRTTEQVTIIKPEDMLHFVNYQPGNTLYGKGELEAAIACAEREFYYDQYENYINRNNARPDFLVSYKNGMTASQQKEIQRLWYKQYGTPMNAGKPMITNGDVDVKQLNFSPRDMQYQMGRTEVRREVCAVYGVPNALVDINNANLASSKSAMDHYRQYTILPKLQKYLEKLNQQLVEKYDENLFVWYDGDMVTSEDPLERANIDKIYMDLGVYGATYVRERIGIEEVQEDAERAESKPAPGQPPEKKPEAVPAEEPEAEDTEEDDKA